MQFNLSPNQVSKKAVVKLRKQLGLIRRTVRYGSFVSEQNRPKRVQFCKDHLEKSFHDCIFVDESAVELHSSRKTVFVKIGRKHDHVMPKVKKPLKVRTRV